jgi:hypothetical protein
MTFPSKKEQKTRGAKLSNTNRINAQDTMLQKIEEVLKQHNHQLGNLNLR